jgi:hypothetical protein
MVDLVTEGTLATDGLEKEVELLTAGIYGQVGSVQLFARGSYFIGQIFTAMMLVMGEKGTDDNV